MLLLLPAWVAVAYVASNLIVVGVQYLLEWLHVPLDTLARPAALQLTITVLVYTLTLAIVIGVPYLLYTRLTTTLTSLGLHRLISWTDIGLAPVTFLVYMVVSATALAMVLQLIPSFPAEEAQDIGFKVLGSQFDNALAFITLVILAPLAEETLFRGYLYGKLKRYIPAVVAAIATSLLFALAHFQLNVGLDVFILSLFLCGLRSLTGSIWAGVLVHIIKNGVAYYILFVGRFIGG